jgi:hypothetical protein
MIRHHALDAAAHIAIESVEFATVQAAQVTLQSSRVAGHARLSVAQVIPWLRSPTASLLTDLTIRLRKEITVPQEVADPPAVRQTVAAGGDGCRFPVRQDVAQETACGCSAMSGGLPGPAWSCLRDRAVARRDRLGGHDGRYSIVESPSAGVF